MATDVNVVYPEATRLVRSIEHALRQLEEGVVAPGAGSGTNGAGARGGAGAWNGGGHGAGAGASAWGGAGGAHGGHAGGAPVASGPEQEQAVAQLLTAVSRDLNALGHHVKSLQSSVGRQAPHRRDLWKSRVHTLSETAASLRRELERLLSRKYARQKDEANRAALLGNANSVVIDCAIKESESIAKSNNMLDELIDAGSNVLTSLTTQRGLLKRAHMKALEMSNTLGLSNSLMRVIQRRTTGDRVLVYGGMVVVCFLLYVVFRYTRAG